jgi:succinate dehydrogenase/fumarate reductase flavoprotein subunit
MSIGETGIYDLVVAGAGLAGMTAAASVAERGGRVLVMEKTAAVGGSSVMSGGVVWTAKDPEQLIRECPKADPALIRTLFEEYPRLIGWCRHLGVDVSEPFDVLVYGRGSRVDLAAYMERASNLIVAAGGAIETRSQVAALRLEGNRVVGVDAFNEGRSTHATAQWTLLAGGGFQGDPELTSRYIHPNASTMRLRSNPASTGDTLRVALDAGASISDGMTGFYGHLISHPIDEWQPGVFTRLSQYHSDHCALVNVLGDWFVPPFDSDHYNAQETLKQPEAKAVMIMDDRVYRNQVSPTTTSVPVNRFDVAQEHGAHTATADTLDALGVAITAWGFDGSRLARAITAFNSAAEGTREPLTRPPFYALEVRPAITFTHGGIRIDSSSRVMDGSGSPIPGLLAAGADAGGVFDWGYGGGLAAAGVFGLMAADRVSGSRDTVPAAP